MKIKPWRQRTDESAWRRHSKAVILGVLKKNPPDLKKALKEAYPFGQRKYWPYKIWCEEVRQALGTTPKPPEVPDDQLTLF